jgi:hypothetical protein
LGTTLLQADGFVNTWVFGSSIRAWNCLGSHSKKKQHIVVDGMEGTVVDTVDRLNKATRFRAEKKRKRNN